MPKLLRRLICGLILATMEIGAALAAPEAELWPRWNQHRPGSSLSVDHAAWDSLLKQHVREGADGIARVDYRALSQNGAGKLKTYLDYLTAIPVDELDRPEQLAFWINLYNAKTVEVVASHWPVKSIRDIDISPGLFSRGPWKKKLLSISGEQLSLDDIEHRILRPIWRDARIHYAVNCASIGCPNLRGEAYRAAALDRQLDEAARAYVNHPRGVQIRGKRLVVSSIYEWFKADFGGSDAAVLAHLGLFAGPELARALAERRRIDEHEYDWRLNE